MRLVVGDVADRVAPCARHNPLINSDLRTVTDCVIEYDKWSPIRMAILRTDIERALDDLASQEEGMRFQGLAVVLGKKRWPKLIARQRKKDLGLDAYAPASLTSEKIGKGLAASITATLRKISGDAKKAKEKFPDLTRISFLKTQWQRSANLQRQY